jgi:hypothetical protein
MWIQILFAKRMDSWFYPLVNVYRTNWKITLLSTGKSTISMAMFKFASCRKDVLPKPAKNTMKSLGPSNKRHLNAFSKEGTGPFLP